MRKLSALLLAAAFMAPAGCSTANQIHDQQEGPAIFGGLRYVGATFSADHTSVGDKVMVCLDAPLSLCLDLLFLPFSAINEVYHGGIEVENVEPPHVIRLKLKRREAERPAAADLGEAPAGEAPAENPAAAPGPVEEPAEPAMEEPEDLPPADLPPDDFPEDDFPEDE